MSLVVAAAILGGTDVYAQASRLTTSYRTALVTYGTITQSIGMAGNLAPVSEADLNFASAGTVQSVYVQVGQTVGAGTPLGTLDSTLLSAQLQQAQATLASAQAKRTQDLGGATAQSLTSAQNSINSAQVSVNNAQTSLADTQAINAQLVSAAQASVNDAQKAVDADQALVDQDNVTLSADAAAAAPASKIDADKAKLAADQQTLSRDQATLNTAKNNLAMTTAKAAQSNDQAGAALASMQQPGALCPRSSRAPRLRRFRWMTRRSRSIRSVSALFSTSSTAQR